MVVPAISRWPPGAEWRASAGFVVVISPSPSLQHGQGWLCADMSVFMTSLLPFLVAMSSTERPRCLCLGDIMTLH